MKLVKLVPAFMILGLALMACGGSTGGGTTPGKKIALLLPEATTARYDTKDMPYFKAKLAELAKAYPDALLGPRRNEAGDYPLLVKILFPHDKLSVQVHPDFLRLDLPTGLTEKNS